MAEQSASSSDGQTHIHDLPEDCLTNILSRVGNAPLPITRRKDRDLTVSHPIQCALVCKRWESCARAAVRSLYLMDSSVLLHLAEQVRQFTGLKRLELHQCCNGYYYLLPDIAIAIPGLESLDLGHIQTFQLDDLSTALRSWSRLKGLHLRYSFTPYWSVTEMQVLVMSILPTMRSVESLSLTFHSLEPELAWESLSPHTTRLKELAWGCTGSNLPQSMALVPSLTLHLSSLPHHVLSFTNIVNLNLLLFGEEELPASLGSLPRLVNLHIEWPQLLVTLPSSLGNLSVLTELVIHNCQRMIELPENIGSLQALKCLQLSTDLLRLPHSLKNLTSVEWLCLEFVEELEDLEEMFSGMQKLKHLELSYFSHIPDSISELSHLTDLRMRCSSCQKSWPSSFGDLSSLKRLILVEAESLPEGLGDLKKLETLDIRDCQIPFLPETLGQLSALTALYFEDCFHVEGLPGSMSNLRNLMDLRITSCISLLSLPVGLTRLTNLRELSIWGCIAFSDENFVITKLRNLRYLGLGGCKDPDWLPPCLENLTALQLIECLPGAIDRAQNAGNHSQQVLEIMKVTDRKHGLFDMEFCRPPSNETLESLEALRKLYGGLDKGEAAAEGNKDDGAGNEVEEDGEGGEEYGHGEEVQEGGEDGERHGDGDGREQDGDHDDDEKKQIGGKKTDWWK